MGAVWLRFRNDPARWVWWGGLVLVLVPFVVSAARLLFGVGDDYLPVQDHSVIEMFVRDVGHKQVLVGLYSRADWSHPGPAQFYALAPFYWLTGGASVGLGVGALAINAASVAGCAAIAQRRGGTPVLLATLVGCALVTRTLGADILSDPWNTYMPVLPYLLLLFLTWSMLCGDLWALPVATVVASFTAQTHVGFMALSLPLVIVGGVALTLPEIRRLVRRRPVAADDESSESSASSEDGETQESEEAVDSLEPGNGDRPEPGVASGGGGIEPIGGTGGTDVVATTGASGEVRPAGGVGVIDKTTTTEVEANGSGDADLVAVTGLGTEERRRRRAVVRAVVLSAGLFALIWLPPVLDVLWNAPSNARQTIEWFERADEGVHTLTDGWRVISAQFGPSPEWISGHRQPAFASGEPLAIYQAPPLPILLFVVAAAAVVLWRRRVPGVPALVVTLGLGLVLGILGVARTVGPAYDYRLRWTWMLPVLGFVLVVWAAWRYLVGWRPATEGRVLVPAALATLLVLGVVNSVSAADAGIPYEDDNGIMEAITPPVLAAFDEDQGGIGGDGQVIVERGENHLGTHTYGRGLVLQLERHGVDARVTATRIRFLPETRNQTEGPVRARLVIAVEEQIDELRRDPDYEMLSLWSPLTDREQDEVKAQMEQVYEDYAAGRITEHTWLDQSGKLDTQLYGHKEVVAYAVAVFLDKRVGNAESWSPPDG